MKQDIKQEIDCELLYLKIQREARLKEEFEKLRPSLRSSISNFVFVLLWLAVFFWYDSGDKSVQITLLALIAAIAFNMHRESERINKRIDLLYEILQKNT